MTELKNYGIKQNSKSRPADVIVRDPRTYLTPRAKFGRDLTKKLSERYAETVRTNTRGSISVIKINVNAQNSFLFCWIFKANEQEAPRVLPWLAVRTVELTMEARSAGIVDLVAQWHICCFMYVKSRVRFPRCGQHLRSYSFIVMVPNSHRETLCALFLLKFTPL